MIVAQTTENPKGFNRMRVFIEQAARLCQRGGDIGRGKSLGHDKGVAELDLNEGFELLTGRMVRDARQKLHGFFELGLRFDAGRTTK